MYTSQQIADWILSRLNLDSGDTISLLKLQKLLYYSQAWHCAIFGKPLFNEKIEAWKLGPIVPSQYNRFLDTDIKIDEMELNVPKLSYETEEFLNEIMFVYGEHSAHYLEKLIHKELPYNITIQQGVGEEIKVELMREYYSDINAF